MIRFKFLCSVFFSVCLSNTAYGFGGVVTDIGSYTYYVEQIEAAYSQLEKAEEQLGQLQETYEEITSIDDKLSGNLLRAKRAFERFENLKVNSLSDLKRAVQYTNLTMGDLLDSEQYVGDLEENIEAVFGSNDSSWVKLELESVERQKASKQKSYKQSLIDAELALGKSNLQLDLLAEYSQMANSTDSSKDAQDVTNALLLEMLANQRELINLTASVSKNIALSSYVGGAEIDSISENQQGKTMTDDNYWDMKPLEKVQMQDLETSKFKGWE